MKKLFIFFLLSSFFIIHADDIIHNVTLLDAKNACISNNYYNKKGKFYYHLLYKDKDYYTSSKKYSLTLIHGYAYDKNTSECYPEPWLVMNMKATDFHFLNALIGLLFGFFMLTVVSYLFMTVGGKK